jgi:glycerol uptake facilitator-like aquaporin
MTTEKSNADEKFPAKWALSILFLYAFAVVIAVVLFSFNFKNLAWTVIICGWAIAVIIVLAIAFKVQKAKT